MLATIIIVLMGIMWLLIETDFLSIQLESTEYQKVKIAESHNTAEVETAETESHYQPSVFTPLELPEFSGSVNIICKIE